MERATRVERALAIRDHLLPMVQAQGAMRRLDGITLVSWQIREWRVALRTPFSHWPGHGEAKPESYHEAMLLQAKPGPLPYGLDLWRTGAGKLLSLEWSETEHRLVTFRRGGWEGEVLAFNAPAAG